MDSTVSKSGLAAALGEAEAAGVLPLTSACNVDCLFCSNRSNPPGARVYSLAPRPVEEVEAALARLACRREIVIGESASRISEGEPLTHPKFNDILRLARRSAPGAKIRLTTNGVLLGPERAELLAELAPVDVTLSLNTASPGAYRRLTGREHDPRAAVRALRAAGVPFHASVVAVPAVTGDPDLAETVRFLEDEGCQDCRVFAPGYTSLTPPAVAAQLPSRAEVAGLVTSARALVSMPVTLEPPLVTNLAAEVAGVMTGSPAARAGVGSGDVISAVDGEEVVSRVGAFHAVLAALRRRGTCRLTLACGGPATCSGGRAGGASPRALTLELTPEEREAGARPGLVMDRDFDPADGRLILDMARGLKARRAVVLTSELAVKAMSLGLEALAGGRGPAARAVAVPARTFGGSIASAGLLTVDDLARCLGGVYPDEAVFLPPLAFDRGGLDLFGKSPADLVPLLPRGARLVVPGLLTL